MLIEQDRITIATFRATSWLRIVGSLVGLGDGLFPLLIIDAVLGVFAYNVIRGDHEEWLSHVVPRSTNIVRGGFLAFLFVISRPFARANKPPTTSDQEPNP